MDDCGALGLAVLFWPGVSLLMLVFVWKLGTEALQSLAGEPIWEFIERGGSCGAPLALAWLQTRRHQVGDATGAVTPSGTEAHAR
jgi:hypothetical protein